MVKITKRSVDATEPSAKDCYLWDDELTGFALKITPAGRKVYLVQYRIGGRKGRTRRVTLGKHGLITCEQARNDAKAVLRTIARGDDPSEVRDQRKQIQRVGELLDQFLDDHAEVRLKSRSSVEYRRLIDKLVPAQLRRKPILEISRPDIARLHVSLKNTPYQANRLLAVLSKFFSWCEINDYRPDFSNPAYHVQKFKEAKRKRFMSEEEIARLGDTLAEVEAENTVSPFVIAAIRLLALTGARLNEIISLRWEYVDLEGQFLELPDSKSGAKRVYLNPPAMQVLADIPRLEGNPFVICGKKKGSHLVNLQKPWRKIRKIAELDDVRIHDLRHSYASIAVASGMSLPLIGALLGHSQPQTTAGYAHFSDDPLKTAAKTVGDRIKIIPKTAKSLK